MANFKRVIFALAAAIICSAAQAGYQSMRPPPGWQPGGQPTYKPAPGEFYDLDKKTWMTLGKANVGGRELSVPVALPLQTGVTVGLAVAAAFSANPAILVAGAAWALYQAYLAQKRITPKIDGTFEQVQDGLNCASDCYEFLANGVWYRTNTAAMAAILPLIQAAQGYKTIAFKSCATPQEPRCYYTYTLHNPNMPGTFTDSYLLSRRAIPPWNDAKIVPVLPDHVSREMQDLPMPKTLVEKLPYPVPVAPPVFNPSPTTGEPQVMRLPQGSPIAMPAPSPNPENLPDRWRTPVIDIIPAPTLYDPWRVEVVPKDIVKTSPSPLPDPLNPTDPLAPPVPDPLLPPADPDQKETPKEEIGLCDAYPDILACAKPELDTPEEPELETVEKDLSFTPQSGWGGAGFCPAARHLPGANVDFKFDMVCDFMRGTKPVVLAVAGLIAGMMLLGARGGAAE